MTSNSSRYDPAQRINEQTPPASRQSWVTTSELFTFKLSDICQAPEGKPPFRRNFSNTNQIGTEKKLLISRSPQFIKNTGGA
jgi:hypothetical protein